MFATKDLDNKIFDYVDPWSETLAYIGWSIRASYHCTIMATLGQAAFDRDMIFKLTSVIDLRVINTANQLQVDFYNAR